MKLPTEKLILSLDKSHASVIYKAELSAATGKIMPMLEVMVIDQYRYQREFSVGRHHEYHLPDSEHPKGHTTTHWEWRIYRHPGRRNQGRVPRVVAERFILRFLELTQQYPGLLFNATGDHTTDKARPNCEGFVHMAEALHDGYEFSHKLLG
jgi:hypothetical protein